MSLLARALGRNPSSAPPNKKRINIALQGGGAYGAFTWGVLDHLLADGRLEIDGISGTSAGAVNAVMLADGLGKGGTEGGADEARKRLAEFWRAASLGGDLPAVQRAVTDRLFSLVPLSNNPAQAWITAWAAFFSPYDFNPLNINPLKDLIERFVDFEALRTGAREIFIAATNVQTGRLHVFSRSTLTAEVVMASACLPTLFRAVEIDGKPYWDGGYTGNPVVSPFFRATETEDLLIIQINPLKRNKVPHSNSEIMSRVQEISFNSALLAELRGVAFINRLIDEGRLPHDTNGSGFRRIKVHRIVLSGLGDRLSLSSKLRTDFESFELLRKLGQRATRRFLDANFDAIGARSSVDLDAEMETEWG